MGFRRGAAGKRRDANEKVIVQALEAAGCEIHYISGLGLPDLLVRAPKARGGFWIPMEVKTAKGRVRASQESISWPIVRSPEEALQVIGCIR